MRTIGTFSRSLFLVALSLLLVACGSNGETTNSGVTAFKLPQALDTMATSRQIDRSVLFAEVILQYDETPEVVIASRDAATDTWQADFRIPAGHDFSIQLTWFDTLDGGRLDLVRFNRSFSATFSSGPLNFDFADYDFDGYDADSDGIVNLAERQSGSSPLLADGSDVPVQLCDDGTVLAPNEVCSEDANPVLDLPVAQLALTAAPAAVVSNNIVLANGGNVALDYTAESTANWLLLASSDTQTGTIQPGQSISLPVEASCPGSITSLGGTITIDSEAGASAVSVALDCRGAVLDVDPQLYTFSADIVGGVGQSDVATMLISNSGNEPLEYSISSDSEWLCATGTTACDSAVAIGTVQPGQTAPLTVTAQCPDTAQTLAGSLSVSSNGGTAVYPATLNCMPVPEPALQLSTETLMFSALPDETATADIVIANPGAAELVYSIATDSDWLSAAPSQGTLPAGGSAALSVQAICGELVATLNGQIAIDSNAGNGTIPVALNCLQAPLPVLMAPSEALSLAADVGASASAQFLIGNTGSADLEVSLSSTSPWLQLPVESFSIVPGATSELAVQANCDAAAGTFNGSIALDSNAGAASIPVTLQCSAPAAPLLELQSEPLSLAAEQNGAATASITFINSGTAALSYQVTSDSDWLTLAVNTGELAPGLNAALPLVASCDALVETRNAVLTIDSNGGSASVDVSLNCTETPLPILSLTTADLAVAAEQSQSVAGAILIANTGSAELLYNATTGADWLQIVPATAVIASGDSASLVVNAQCGPNVEDRLATVLIDSDGGGASVPVTLTCSAAPAPLLQAPSAPETLAALQNQTSSNSFVLGNTGTALLSYTLESDSGWLQLAATGGQIEAGDTATIAYDASCADTVEVRSGAISILSDGGNAGIAVTLDCSAEPVGVLNVLASELTLDALQNNSATAGFVVENNGTASLNFNASSDSTWLQVDSPVNTLNPGQSVTLAVSASCDDLVQTRNGTITVESAGVNTDIPVSLTCNAPAAPLLSVSPDQLTLVADEESGATGVIEIANAGTAVLNYTVVSSESWLVLDSSVEPLAVDSTAELLFIGQCAGNTGVLESVITVDSNGGTASVPVTLNCSALASPLLEVQTAELDLVAERLGSVSAAVQLENTGSSDLTIDIDTTVDWLSVTSANPLVVTPGEVATATFLASCSAEVEVLGTDILFVSDGGSGTVPVTVDCRGAVLRVDPPLLSLTGEIDEFGFDAGAVQGNLAFFNDGNEPLDFTVTSDSDWLCPDDPGSAVCAPDVDSFSATVEPGEFYSLPVVASCGSVPEERNGLFSVVSNGGNTQIPVELFCSETPLPQLVLTPSSIIVNPVDVNTTVSQQITLGNTGTALLNYTVLSEQDWIIVTDDSGTLEPDQFIDIDVQLACEATPGPFTGQLMVSWDQADEILPVEIFCEDLVPSVTQINVDGGSIESGNEIIFGRPTPVQVIGESFSPLAGVQIDGGSCEIDSVTPTEVLATCTVTNPVFRDFGVELLVSDIDSTSSTRVSVGSTSVFVNPRGYNRVDEIVPLELAVGEAVEITATGIFNSTISVSVSNGTSFSECTVLNNGLTEIVASCSLPDASYTQLVFSAADGVEVESGVATVQPIETGPNLGCPVIPEAQSNVNDEPLLVYENPVRFTDDFNNGLPRYSARFFGAADPDSSLSIENGAATLSVTGTASDSSSANIEPVIVDDPDSLFVRVQIPSESTAVDSDDSATDSRFRLVGNFFNSVNDGGTTDPAVNFRAGDVQLTLSVRNYQEGDARSDFIYCAQVIGDDGSRGFFVDFTEDGDGDGCATIDSLPVDLEYDREYLLGIGVDRAAGTVFFQVDDTRVSELVPTPILRARSPGLFASVAATGASVSSIANISEIAVDGNIDTMLSDLLPGVVDRYANLNGFASQPNRSVVATGGQVEIRGSSEDGSSTFTSLNINGDTDYIAADLVLSGDSLIEDANSHATVFIGGSVYNDLSNGGIEGSMEGDVRASVEILSLANGSSFASACMFRLQTDGFDDVCTVIAPNSFCLPFSTAVQTDVSYRTSIEMDRENRRVVFRLDDEEIIHNIQTNAFLPAAGRKFVSTRMRGAGVAVGVTDNLSTINPVSSDGG